MNPIKGEVELELKDGRKFVLVGDFQSRVVAEEAYGKPYRFIVRDAAAEYLGAVRALLYGLMKRHQPDLTLEDVGELIDTSGAELMEAAEKAMDQATPKSEGKEGANPPKPQRGKKSGASGAKQD